MFPSTSSKSTFLRDDNALLIGDRSSSEKPLTEVPTNGSLPYNLNEKKPESSTLRRLLNKSSVLFNKSTTTKDDDVATYELGFHLPRGITTNPAPYLRPLEHRLVAREEPNMSVKVNINVDVDIDSDDDLEHIIPSVTRARRRVETMHRLDGTSSKKTLSEIQEDEAQIGNRTLLSFEKELFEPQAHNESAKLPDRATVVVDELHQAAVIMASTPQDVDRWYFYLECYVKGNFTLKNPPPPPSESPASPYLSAMMPFIEDQRLALSKEFACLWPSWNTLKLRSLFNAAMSRFDTTSVTFSFFDGSHEILKAERGLNMGKIERSVSIAAHVLYTTEVMSLLDARQDWRFAGNPLVTQSPFIRFFAGAPLLSDSGLVMGVFAVFSQKPRQSFTPLDRRVLAEYSAELMKDLGHQLEDLKNTHSTANVYAQDQGSQASEYQPPEEILQNQVYSPRQHEHPEEYSRQPDYVGSPSQYQSPDESLRHPNYVSSPSQYQSQEESVMLQTQFHPPLQYQNPEGSLRHPRQFSSPPRRFQHQHPEESSMLQNQVESASRYQSSEGSPRYPNRVSTFEPTFLPQALRYERPEASISTDLYAVKPVAQASYVVDQTPPPSRERMFEHSIEDDNVSYLGPEGVSMVPDCSFQVLPSFPYVEDNQITRPFSSSDLTSIYPLPPNSPDRSLMGDELSHHPNIKKIESQDFDDSLIRSSRMAARQQSIADILEPARTNSRPAISINDVYQSDSGSDYSSVVSLTVTHRAPAGIEDANVLPQQYVVSRSTSYDHLLENFENVEVPEAQPAQHTENFIDRILPTWGKSVGGKAAQMMFENLSQYMRYDIAYLCKVKPFRPGLSDDELLKPRGMTIEVLLRYGNVGSLNLKTANHLRALRSKTHEHWSFKSDEVAENHYKHGCMMSILPNEALLRKDRDSGLVLGVFAREIPQIDMTVTREITILRDFEKVLKGLFENPHEYPRPQVPAHSPPVPSPAQPQAPQHLALRSPAPKLMNDPPGFQSRQFPANEATELHLR